MHCSALYMQAITEYGMVTCAWILPVRRYDHRRTYLGSIWLIEQAKPRNTITQADVESSAMWAVVGLYSNTVFGIKKPKGEAYL